MAKKYTYEIIKTFFEDNSCELLETKFVNTHTKMCYKCSCGNISIISFNNFSHGQRCINCRNKLFNKKYSHSYEQVYNYFKERKEDE
jgi:hypothetical protein